MNRKTTLLSLAGLASALALGAGAGATAYALLDDDAAVVRQVAVTGSQPVAAPSELTAAEIYERAAPSVVKITVRSAGSPFDGRQAGAVGSGFVYDAQGHVVTNQHVVQGTRSASVLFSDGSSYPATVVGTDPSTDLAVLDVAAPAEKLRPLQLGDSSQVAVGDPVVALGSPFGLEGTLTAGVVSAVDRQMTAPNGFTITDSIQTDAAITHGNSGGPLLDAHGSVIGVNAQIESESGGNDGVGFAIPADTVRIIVPQLLASGSVRHAYLGIGLTDVGDGVAVTEVRPDTPAERAGLRAATGTAPDGTPTGGDVIVAIDGKPVATSADLQRAVDAKRPGDAVTLTVVRSGERLGVDVTLGVRPS